MPGEGRISLSLVRYWPLGGTRGDWPRIASLVSLSWSSNSEIWASIGDVGCNDGLKRRLSREFCHPRKKWETQRQTRAAQLPNVDSTLRERVASSLFYRNSSDLQRLSTSSILRRSRRSFLEKQLRHLTCPFQPVGRQAEDRLPDSRCQPVPGRDELSQRRVRAAIVQPAAPTLDASGMLPSNLRNMGHGCNSRRLHFLVKRRRICMYTSDFRRRSNDFVETGTIQSGSAKPYDFLVKLRRTCMYIGGFRRKSNDFVETGAFQTGSAKLYTFCFVSPCKTKTYITTSRWPLSRRLSAPGTCEGQTRLMPEVLYLFAVI